MPQEALLPDTKAIRKATVEIDHYRRGWLVRYKNMKGYVRQRQFKDVDEANDFFWECVGRLKAEVQNL